MTTQTATEYVIISISHYYGPSTRRTLVDDERTGRAARFTSRAEAHQHIDEYLASGPLYLNHNQYGQDYRIARIDRLPQYLAWEL